ncbi:hypothetical protein [Metabacillus indicus]|uniref:hypothetical protein n=1 Tax=Metabacillus indicus TaxID=246786 RepID=UPI003CE8BEF6
METVYLICVVAAVGFFLFNLLRKNRRLPNNEYTPMNDIDNGLVRNYHNEIPLSESKHEARYEDYEERK